MKILIVYYSLGGNTEFIAQKIGDELNASILRLEPVNDIEKKGFMRYVRGGKQVLFNSSPKLKNFDENLIEYDLIILGTPVWAGRYTPAFKTLFEKYKFDNKKLAIYCCHDGGKGKVFQKFRDNLPNAQIISEKEFERTSKNREKRGKEAVKWAKTLN
ncbi:MAG: NAD(P)H-dependent oxidoreductase [Clostridiales bacterium]